MSLLCLCVKGGLTPWTFDRSHDPNQSKSCILLGQVWFRWPQAGGWGRSHVPVPNSVAPNGWVSGCLCSRWPNSLGIRVTLVLKGRDICCLVSLWLAVQQWALSSFLPFFSESRKKGYGILSSTSDSLEQDSLRYSILKYLLVNLYFCYPQSSWK